MNWKGKKSKLIKKNNNVDENIYSNIATAKENWKKMSIILSVAIVILSIMLVKSSETNKIQTYIIEKDGINTKVLGNVNSISNNKINISDNEIIYFINEVIYNTKTLPRSQRVYEKSYKKALPFLSRNASNKMDNYLKVEKYVQKAKDGKTIDIVFNTGTKLPDIKNIYQIRWKQFTYDKEGNLIDEKNFNGNFTVEIQEVKNERMLYSNPLGIVITDISQKEEKL
ncbi:type IV secretion system protein [Fusobacterium sp. SYSU M8D902]|uniref:type IV secretion system protein n=1 Tax=Fusobacterium sp. SYSU M8D902 TaxID=3159562 RepID=UPI0032E49EDD